MRIIYIYILVFLLSIFGIFTRRANAIDSPDGAIFNRGIPMSAQDHYNIAVAMSTYGASALRTKELCEWLALPPDAEILFNFAKQQLDWKSWTIVSFRRVLTCFDESKEEIRKGRVILNYDIQMLFDNMWLAYFLIAGTCSSNAAHMLDKVTSYTLDTSSDEFKNLNDKEKTLISTLSRNVRRNGRPLSLTQEEQNEWEQELILLGGLRALYSEVEARTAERIEYYYGLRPVEAKEASSKQ